MTLDDARDEMMIAAELLTQTREQFALGNVGQAALTLAETEYQQARSIVARLSL
jgi:hypothetical protein